MMLSEGYNPRTWRTQPLHMIPPEAEEFSWDDPRTIASLDWIFLISSLNFSFWSDKRNSERYGVQWRESWTSGEKEGETVEVYTGYCSLVAAINKGLPSRFECSFLTLDSLVILLLLRVDILVVNSAGRRHPVH